MPAIIQAMNRAERSLAERAPALYRLWSAPPQVKAFRYFAGLTVLGIAAWAGSSWYHVLEIPGILLLSLGFMALGFSRAYTKGWGDRFARVEHINSVIAVSTRWAQRRVGHTCPLCGILITEVREQADERHPVHDIAGNTEQLTTALTYVSGSCGHMLGFVKVG